jgi:hypothetical protein
MRGWIRRLVCCVIAVTAGFGACSLERVHFTQGNADEAPPIDSSTGDPVIDAPPIDARPIDAPPIDARPIDGGSAVCGNRITEPGEQCDTGGASPTCNADCTNSRCGDGKANPAAGEQCDTSGESATCNADCTNAACGDRKINAAAGEQCDTGGASATCDDDCTNPVCGDRKVNPFAGEVCDDGNTLACGTCNATCSAVTAASATGRIAAVPGSKFVPGDVFTLDDSVNRGDFVFESGITGRHIVVIDASFTSQEVATAIANAINGSGIKISASVTSNLVMLVNQRAGIRGNVAIVESVQDPNFTVSGMSGGLAGDCGPGVGCASNADCASGICKADHSCQ